MTTIQALICGGICGFILGGICWVMLGLTIGLLQEGIGDAVKQKLKIENQENKNNG
tara:strand:- start:461 stop:628 length:168 start_codon:yes stop_codon:yes gene_type:complete